MERRRHTCPARPPRTVGTWWGSFHHDRLPASSVHKSTVIFMPVPSFKIVSHVLHFTSWFDPGRPTTWRGLRGFIRGVGKWWSPFCRGIPTQTTLLKHSGQHTHSMCHTGSLVTLPELKFQVYCSVTLGKSLLSRPQFPHLWVGIISEGCQNA